jgi:hypothetical protein
MSVHPPPEDAFSISRETREGIPVFYVTGYFAEKAGNELLACCEPHLAAHRHRLVVDLGRCQVINSPGLVRLMDLTVTVVEDHQGTLVLTGLSELHTSLMELGGVFPLAWQAPDVDEAIHRLRQDQPA